MKLLLLLLLIYVSVGVSSPISHVIVLMMENRSFDHLLGWLKKSFSPNINGLTEDMTVPRDPNDITKGNIKVNNNGFDISPDDPPHDYDNIKIQLNNGHMDGFILDAIETNRNESNPISMFDINSAPIINTLGLEYAIFDNWYCSVPGPTDPNRAYAMSGTSNGAINNFNGTLWTQQSYFDFLRENNHTFNGYFQDDLWALGYFKDMLKPENIKNIKPLEFFYEDLKNNNIADFIWLQPRSSTHQNKLPTWQHPDASVALGEELIKEIYEAIRSSNIWNETLFIITYDEHGGFYDHVSPPTEGVPNPDNNYATNGYTFNSLGVRIPTIAISPWIKKGSIISTNTFPNERPTSTSQFESTSILSTTNSIFNINKSLSNRMSWSNKFTELFSESYTGLKQPRTDCPLTLPNITTYQSNEERLKLAQYLRNLPINDALLEQILYFCIMNHNELHQNGQCPDLPMYVAQNLHTLNIKQMIGFNQGMASDWLHNQNKLFRKKMNMI